MTIFKVKFIVDSSNTQQHYIRFVRLFEAHSVDFINQQIDNYIHNYPDKTVKLFVEDIELVNLN